MRPVVRRAVADVLHGARAWAQRAGAVTGDDRRGRRFAAFGEASMLAWPPGPTFGERHIAIGSGTLVGPNVSLVVGMAPDEPLELPDPDGIALRIGDRVNIGRGSSIAARHSLVIEDDVTTAADVYVTDHDHGYEDLDTPITLQWPVCAPVRIGAGSWLGTGVVVCAGADIGRHVVVAANSVVRGTIPDDSVIGGVPAKVLRRHTAEGWDPPLPERAPGAPPPPDWPT